MKYPLKINADGKAINSSVPSALPAFSNWISKPMPNPTAEMLNGDPIFDAIWEVIKSWDVNVPESYNGYMGANGSHVTLIYDALMKVLSKP